MSSLWNRVSDPGTIRSLVLAIFMFKGLTIDPGVADVIANGVLGVLALASAVMKPKAVVAVEAVTEHLDRATAVVQSAAADTAIAADKLQGVLGTTR